MTGRAPRGLDVRGGSGGTHAHLEDLLRYARELDRIADDVRTVAGQLGRGALDADVARAAVLCPVEAATVHAALTVALTGPRGALAVSVELELLARSLRWAVESYRLVDQMCARAMESAGVVSGMAVGVPIGMLAVAVAGTLVANPVLLGALAPERRRLAAFLERTVYDQPWVQEVVTRALPGLAQAPFAFAAVAAPMTWPAVALATGGRWPSVRHEESVEGFVTLAGHVGVLRDTGRFTAARAGVEAATLHPKRFVTGLLRRQARMDRGPRRRLAVLRIEQRDGSPAYVVQIPGTQSWDPVRSDSPLDAATNLHLMADGPRTVMEGAVLQAMRDVGVTRDDPVLLVGHSQGGMTAAALASDPGVRREYDIRGVVAAGSPIARLAVPDGVAVLALEHDQDLVPKLDAAPNPDRAGWLTVTRDLGGASDPTLGRAHDSWTYVETAALVDASVRRGDESLARWADEVSQVFTGRGTAFEFELTRER